MEYEEKYIRAWSDWLADSWGEYRDRGRQPWRNPPPVVTHLIGFVTSMGARSYWRVEEE